MADEIRTLSAELARDPTSHAFVPLAELLRARGQLDAAERVVVEGLSHHPSLAEARDLYGRILSDRGDLDGAEREWKSALEQNPLLIGAHKGLGFIRFRNGDLDGALEHLETALSVDPSDAALVQALRTVRAAALAGYAPDPAPAAASGLPGITRADAPAGSGRTTAAVFAVLEGDDQGLLLVDRRGRVLGGSIHPTDGGEGSEAVAAHLAGVMQEADRTARILKLGTWSSLFVETPAGVMHISQPAEGSALLLVRDRSVPAGRLEVLAEKAAQVARRWLQVQEL